MSSFIRSDSFMLKDVNVIIQRANKNWIYSCSQKNHQIVNIILPNQSYTKEEDIKSRWVIFCIGLLLWHDDSLWYRPSLEPKKAPPGSLFNLLCLSVCLPYISQPFCIGMDWNLAWWLFRWYRPSIEPSSYSRTAAPLLQPCPTCFTSVLVFAISKLEVFESNNVNCSHFQ